MDITFDKLEYDPGDSRSMGHLLVEANTPKGKLRISLGIGSGGELEDCCDDDGFWLNGEEMPDDETDFHLFDPGLAHAYAGDKAVARSQQHLQEWVTEAIIEFLK